MSNIEDNAEDKKEDIKETEPEKTKEKPVAFTKLILIFESSLLVFSLFFLGIGLKVFLGIFLMGSFLFFLVLTLVSLFKRNLRTTFWLPIVFIACIMSLIIFIVVVNIPFVGTAAQETGAKEVSGQREVVEEPAGETKAKKEAVNEETIEDIKSKAIENLGYDELLRHNEEYIGEIVYYRGKVDQVSENWGGSYTLRIFVTKGEYGLWEDDIWANYKGERVLEGDIVDIWGKVKGVKKYTTVLGSSRSIPEIDILHLEVETIEEESDTGKPTSRDNPATLGEVVTVTIDDWLTGKVTLEIEMVEVVSGDEAWEMVRSANQFNEKPEEGKEYILAKFRIKVIKAEEDKPYGIGHSKFDVISGDGVEYTDFISVSGLEPDLETDLYEGAEYEGWTYFMVDKDDDNPLAVFERQTDTEIWFKLRA